MQLFFHNNIEKYIRDVRRKRVMQAMGKRTVRRNKVVWQDAVIAILFGTIIVAGILCVARTIWSGYHFLDDHELIRMEQSFSQGMSLHDLLRAWIKNDMNQRFRPLY